MLAELSMLGLISFTLFLVSQLGNLSDDEVTGWYKIQGMWGERFSGAVLCAL